MKKEILENTHDSLLEKRQTIQEWLDTTPEEKKKVHLGPVGEPGVQKHLEVLETALEKIDDQKLGCCTVCCDYIESDLLEMDYTAEVCLEHMSTAEMRQLESELAISRSIQKAMLPQRLPVYPGIEVAFYSQPAQIVSGDYLNFTHFRDGTLGIVIADVMGHGVSSSLVMSSVHTLLQTLIPENKSPGEVLRKVNRLFLHNVRFTTFFTLFLAQFDYQSGTLTYSNAGHNPPYIVRKDGYTVERAFWLDPTGAAVGLVEDFQISEKTLLLNPGDLLVAYTDGFTEAINPQGEPFGAQRLANVASRDSVSPPNSILQSLRRELVEFTQGSPLEDDATLVITKIKPASSLGKDDITTRKPVIGS